MTSLTPFILNFNLKQSHLQDNQLFKYLMVRSGPGGGLGTGAENIWRHHLFWELKCFISVVMGFLGKRKMEEIFLNFLWKYCSFQLEIKEIFKNRP